MKKTFLARRNKLLSSAGVPWGVLALLCVLFILLVRLLAPDFLLHIFSPVYRAADAISAGSNYFISGFKNTAELAIQNAKLTNENATLANENQALFQKASAFTALGDSGIQAGVVARPPESPYDTFVLAEGAQAGVTLGMEAFGPGEIPLGIVSSVLADFSRVTLFSAPGIATSGWVGNGHTPITLQGAGAGAFNASASRAENISVGDIVFIPGPNALPIGKVARIDSDSSSPSVTLRIAPSLNLFSITEVTLRDMGSAFADVPVCATSTLP